MRNYYFGSGRLRNHPLSDVTSVITSLSLSPPPAPPFGQTIYSLHSRARTLPVPSSPKGTVLVLRHRDQPVSPRYQLASFIGLLGRLLAFGPTGAQMVLDFTRDDSSKRSNLSSVWLLKSTAIIFRSPLHLSYCLFSSCGRICSEWSLVIYVAQENGRDIIRAATLFLRSEIVSFPFPIIRFPLDGVCFIDTHPSHQQTHIITKGTSVIFLGYVAITYPSAARGE